MVDGTDGDAAWAAMLLEVALEAKDGVAFGEELLVHRTVVAMAGGAAFAERLVFEDVRAALGLVAGDADFVGGAEGGTAAFRGVAARVRNRRRWRARPPP